MCVCVKEKACVCVRERESVCVRVRECLCVCVCAQNSTESIIKANGCFVLCEWE